MKTTIKFFSVFFMVALLASCSSDDNGNQLPEIVGTWDLSEANMEASKDLNEDGTAHVDILDEIPCLRATLTFAENGNYSQTATEVDDNYNCTGVENTMNGTYRLEDGKLHISLDGGDEPVKVAYPVEIRDGVMKLQLYMGEEIGNVEIVLLKLMR